MTLEQAIAEAKGQALRDGCSKVRTDTRIVFATLNTNWNRKSVRPTITMSVYDAATNKKLTKANW